jgi:hypothetical protein
MQPVPASSNLYRNSSEILPEEFGQIMVFAPEGIVRIYDKTGIQTATYYDSSSLRSVAVPNGAFVSLKNGTNVTTVTYNGQRYLTQIFE